MNSVSKSDFARLTAQEIKSILPTVFKVEGEAVAIVCQPEDVIFIGDMHPRVKNQLKALEAKARLGMMKFDPVDIVLSELRKVQE